MRARGFVGGARWSLNIQKSKRETEARSAVGNFSTHAENMGINNAFSHSILFTLLNWFQFFSRVTVSLLTVLPAWKYNWISVLASHLFWVDFSGMGEFYNTAACLFQFSPEKNVRHQTRSSLRAVFYCKKPCVRGVMKRNLMYLCTQWLFWSGRPVCNSKIPREIGDHQSNVIMIMPF